MEPTFSRRRFVLGTAGLLGAALGAASCGSGGSRTAAPRITVRTLAPPATTPPVPPRQPLEPLRLPLPSWFRSGPPDRASVAVTVDDLFTPADADALGRLLDVAKAKRVRCSFFPTGGALEVHLAAGKQDAWRRVVDEGHDIGNHTYTHRRLPTLSDDDIRWEIARSEELLAAVLGAGSGYRMRLLRPPGGDGGTVSGGDPRIMGVITPLGYSMAMWSIDSAGTTGNASYLAKIVAGATKGSIVLTHFTTFAQPNFAGLFDRLRTERGLETTSITGLFG